MKKYGILITAFLAVLACVLPLIAAEEAAPAAQPTQPAQPAGQGSGGGQRFGREMQTQAITAIEAELAKMKTAMEGMPAGGREAFQNMSEEERTQMRDRMQKMREERVASVGAIEDQLAKLKGSRALTQEHDQAIEALQALKATADKENAKETAAAIQKMIDEKNQAFEARMAKLEMEPRRGGMGGAAGQNRPGAGG
jgi:hypothetical protein